MRGAFLFNGMSKKHFECDFRPYSALVVFWWARLCFILFGEVSYQLIVMANCLDGRDLNHEPWFGVQTTAGASDCATMLLCVSEFFLSLMTMFTMLFLLKIRDMCAQPLKKNRALSGKINERVYRASITALFPPCLLTVTC